MQLMNIISCDDLMHGAEAEVNWYIGGNSYVKIHTAVAEANTGVHLARTEWTPPDVLQWAWDNTDPPLHHATISELHRLGNRREFVELANESRSRGQITKYKYDRLMEMLTVNISSAESDSLNISSTAFGNDLVN